MKSNEISMTPYMVRAMVEWAEASGLTPMVSVELDDFCMGIPAEHFEKGTITLNVSGSATGSLSISNESLAFRTRFGGVVHDVAVPVCRISSVFAREDGRGMAFEVQETAVRNYTASVSDISEKKPQSGKPRPKGSHLKLVK